MHRDAQPDLAADDASASASSLHRWELYRVLSEPVRLQLLALTAKEELAVGELAELLDENQPNISRHVAPLRQAGLVSVRKQGTRVFLRLEPRAATDPVVVDALRSGQRLCEVDGSLSRVGQILQARDEAGREFFAHPRGAGSVDVPSELGAFLRALAPLLPRRALGVDAGTGDGALLDVLAPVFDRVVAVDRSAAQLAHAGTRVALRQYKNVELVQGNLDDADVRRAAKDADVVFAVRVLHHAARPGAVVRELASWLAPGGALVVLDYAHHDDESMREQADVWLGFEPNELKAFAREAGLDASVEQVPPMFCGRGRDAHLPWQLMVARKGESLAPTPTSSPEANSARSSTTETNRIVRNKKGTRS